MFFIISLYRQLLHPTNIKGHVAVIYLITITLPGWTSAGNRLPFLSSTEKMLMIALTYLEERDSSRWVIM